MFRGHIRIQRSGEIQAFVVSVLHCRATIAAAFCPCNCVAIGAPAPLNCWRRPSGRRDPPGRDCIARPREVGGEDGDFQT
jgi:hypothetical protein